MVWTLWTCNYTWPALRMVLTSHWTPVSQVKHEVSKGSVLQSRGSGWGKSPLGRVNDWEPCLAWKKHAVCSMHTLWDIVHKNEKTKSVMLVVMPGSVMQHQHDASRLFLSRNRDLQYRILTILYYMSQKWLHVYCIIFLWGQNMLT